MRIAAATLSAVAALALMVAVPSAQEHPQEHPSGEKSKKSMNIQVLSKAIHGYVESDSELKGGYFLVYDPVAKKALPLKLDKVHEDKLATLGGGVYFACADFKAPDGTVYDLDVFMKGKPGHLEPTDVSIHKVAGEPRYTWKEEGGVWKKVDA